MALEQNTGAPSEVISLAAPHRVKYWRRVVMTFAELDLVRRKIESQLL